MKHARHMLSLSLLAGWLIASAQTSPYVEPLATQQIFKGPVSRLAYAPATHVIAATPSEAIVKLFDAYTLTEKLSLSQLSARVSALGFSPSGQILVTGAVDGKAAAWNTSTGTPTRQISLHSSSISALAVQNETIVVSAGLDQDIKVTDVIADKEIASISDKDEATAMTMLSGGNTVMLGFGSGLVRMYSVPDLKETKSFSESKSKLVSLALNTNGTLLACGYGDGNVFVWNLQTMALKFKVAAHKNTVAAIAFDPKSRWLLTSSPDSSTCVIDIASGTITKSFGDPSGYATALVFLNDEEFLAGTNTGILKKWHILPEPPDTMAPSILVADPVPGSTPRVLATEYEVRGYAVDDKNIAGISLNGAPVTLTTLSQDETAKLPPGTVGMKFKHSFKLDTVGFNNFSLEARDKAGHASTAVGRVQRLTTEQAVEIQMPINEMEIDSVTLPIRFKAWFDIASYSVTVNLIEIISGGIPTTRIVGATIVDEVPLVVGYNQIQISVSGKNGERYSRTMGVTRKAAEVSIAQTPEVKKKRERGVGPQKWAVVVGVSEYKSSGIPSLKYADKDADAFANFLRRPEGGGYDNEHLKVLLNKDGTLANIKDALINFLAQAIDMDLVIIYFAGHGAPEPARQQNLYLLTYDSDPNSLGTTSFPMWDIETVLRRHINAKRVVVFTDACHSGGISVNYATRGLGVTEQNMINQYLTDLANTKEGTVVFTASAAGETSQEFPELAHGAFTYYLLEGLGGKADYNNDYTITINEAMQYTEEMVKRKTRGAQNPTRSQTSYDKELTIAIVPL
ncbi:MAG: caspase family protein [Ignavibacteriales bacterium]|nr:caspase family protein [Ignavibacteriales bacterium]